MKPFLLALICFCASLQAQDRYTLSGTVRDTNSNESLIGVNILVPGLGTGTITNEYGFYSITLPKGSYEVVLQALGFETKSTRIILDKNIKLNFSLSEEAELLDEIVLTERSDQLDLRSPQMGVNTLPVSTIQQVPVVLGEADVLKSLLLLPGVTNAGEVLRGSMSGAVLPIKTSFSLMRRLSLILPISSASFLYSTRMPLRMLSCIRGVSPPGMEGVYPLSSRSIRKREIVKAFT